MGALARALLLPLVAQWLLLRAATAPAPFTLPLHVAIATARPASPTPVPGTPALPRADGLALALEPAGAAANFLAMVDNLQGDSGRGYYLEMLIGTPPQKVGGWGWARLRSLPPLRCSSAGTHGRVGAAPCQQLLSPLERSPGRTGARGSGAWLRAQEGSELGLERSPGAVLASDTLFSKVPGLR